ncbi:MAG: recombinase family protein [Lachnospiraceae bacterium]|nr:recombinase family protein [Lachnospiraceae bacterium]
MSATETAFDRLNVLPTPFVNLDRDRTRRTVFYGRVSTEHEAQISALENQIQWYDDQAKMHKNWDVLGKYIDEGITGTQAKKRPSFLRMLEDARLGKFDLIVTREVCRFARNTVDTLVVTRELKNLGIEVYFVDDNIWTMDGDGELRLTIMATLAQEESRKVSERVKAGQHISREKCTIYGSGNILGYDKVGDKYVINTEQAETVRMIYDMYLTGEIGAGKIAEELFKRGRLTSYGTTNWTSSYVSRVLKNPTYMGYMAYGKSFSNNYLDQKRINNTRLDNLLYKKADFEPIVTEEEFQRVQELKEKRRRSLHIPQYRKTPFGEEEVLRPVRDTYDIWKKKVRCKCGATFRKETWHVKKSNNERVYGYQCYNRVNYGSDKKRKLYPNMKFKPCDQHMIAEWKLDFMCSEVLKMVWTERKEAIEEAVELIKKYYKEEKRFEDKGTELKKKYAKLNQKMANLRDMRADGDLDSDDFHTRMKKLLDEKAQIEAELKTIAEKPQERLEDELDWDKIKEVLNESIDVSNPIVPREIIERLIARVETVEDNKFRWYVNLSGADQETINAVVTGIKKNNVIALSKEDAGKESHFFC